MIELSDSESDEEELIKTVFDSLEAEQQWRTQDIKTVHDFMVFPGFVKHIIDHKIFQRMREIKQLGKFIIIKKLFSRINPL